MSRSNPQLKSRCYRNPLCQWSWFNETCSCNSSPCLTEFCAQLSFSFCVCSNVFCTEDDQKIQSICRNLSTPNSQKCYCDSNYKQDSLPASEDPMKGSSDIEDLLDHVIDEETKNVLRLMRHARLDDLIDVQEDLMPTIMDIYHFGIEFDSLIISCSFEGNRCDRQNFTVLYNPRYGKCYMFNYAGSSNNTVEKPLDIYNYGSNTGLNLLLLIEKQKSLNMSSREIGARVVVHDPYSLPFVSEFGINVQPHGMTSVEVTFTETQRLGRPWGRCMEKVSELSFPYRSRIYTLLECEKKCRDYYMQKHCRCTKRQFQRGNIVLDAAKDFVFCSVFNETQWKCMNGVSTAIENGSIICGCSPACHEKIYSTTTSSSLLNENFYRSIKAVRTLRKVANETIYTDPRDEYESMVGLKIYYNTFQVTEDIEVPSYSWETLVANIGGNLGFFMGLSLMTFFEVGEFVWDLVSLVVNSVDRKSNRVSQGRRTIRAPKPHSRSYRSERRGCFRNIRRGSI